jgi:hypothetical protein
VVEEARLPERKLGQDAPARVDDRRDAGVGRADERQPLLHGADAGLREVLVGTADLSEPRVVGDLEEEVGARGRARIP